MLYFKKWFKLIAIGISLGIVVSFFSFLIIHEIEYASLRRDEIKQNVFATAQRDLISCSEVVDEFIKSQNNTIGYIVQQRSAKIVHLAESVVVKFGLSQQAQQILQLLSQENDFINAMAIATKDKKILYQTSGFIYKPPYDEILDNAFKYGSYLKSFDNRKIIFSYYSKKIGKFFIFDLKISAIRSQLSEQIITSLGSINDRNKFKRSFIIDTKQDLYIIPQNKTYIPFSDIKKFFPKNIKSLLDKLKTSDHGEFIDIGRDDGSTLYAYILYNKEFGWYIGTFIPYKELETRIKQKSSYVIRALVKDIGGLLIISVIFFATLLLLTNKSITLLMKDIDTVGTSLQKALHMNSTMSSVSLKYFESMQLVEKINKALSNRIEISEKLEQYHKLLVLTLNSIDEAIITVGQEGNVTYANNAAHDLFSKGALLNTDIDDLFKLHGIDIGSIKDFLQSNKEFEQEISYENKTIFLKIKPVVNIENVVIYLLVVMRDITLEKEMRREIEKKRKLDSLGLLSAGLAHDFNNIMSGIYGNIQLAQHHLQQKNLNEVNEFLKSAVESIDRAVKLTQQLMTFTKGGVPVIGHVDIGELIRSVVLFNLSGSNVNVHFDIAEDLEMAAADENQVSDVISNLVINAKQSMEETGGNIYVKAKNVRGPLKINFKTIKGDFVMFSIRDDGPGIPPENIDKIFDPYFTTKSSGTGIGLSIVYSIIKQHNGYITVESELGKGTVFKIYLPIAKSVSTESKKVENLPSITDKNIILIEDEDHVRNVVASMLESLGHKVSAFSGPDEAIKHIHQIYADGEKIDVIITDLTLKGAKPGLSYVEEYRAIDANIKIIVYSGYIDSEIAANPKEHRIDGFIQKPITFESLQRAIAALYV